MTVKVKEFDLETNYFAKREDGEKKETSCQICTSMCQIIANIRNPIRVVELRVFEFLLKYCSQNGIGICWKMSKKVQNGSLQEPQTIQNTQWVPRSGSQRRTLLSLASLRMPFCICLDILQQMPMPFWLKYLSRNSNTLSSNSWDS